jgi:hypothetical protein
MQKKTRLLLSVLLLFFGLLCVVAQAQDGIAVETGRPEFIEKMLEKTSEESRAEVAALLKLDDDQLLEAIACRTFQYFWQEVNPRND